MSDAVYTAGTGAMVQQMRLEMLANNLANVNSPGYKADKALFRSSLATARGEEAVTGVANHHVRFDGSRIDFSAGPVKATDNSLDLAIDGPGFFSVNTPEGVRYTRAGNFSRDAQGMLVTQDGHRVLGEGGEILLGNGSVQIDAQGRVSVDGDVTGRIAVVDFPDAGSLEKVGSSLFAPVDGAAGENPGQGTTVRQGYVEMANVNPVLAMTEMIDTLRTYEAYQKMMRAVSDADAKSINDVGKPA